MPETCASAGLGSLSVQAYVRALGQQLNWAAGVAVHQGLDLKKLPVCMTRAALSLLGVGVHTHSLATGFAAWNP